MVSAATPTQTQKGCERVRSWSSVGVEVGVVPAVVRPVMRYRIPYTGYVFPLPRAVATCLDQPAPHPRESSGVSLC